MQESGPHKQTTVRAALRTGIDGMTAFLDAFFQADDDADIECRLGEPEDAPANVCLILTIGSTTVAITPAEARKMAEFAEDAMRQYPRERDAAALPNLILGLRAGADKAEEYARARQ